MENNYFPTPEELERMIRLGLEHKFGMKYEPNVRFAMFEITPFKIIEMHKVYFVNRDFLKRGNYICLN